MFVLFFKEICCALERSKPGTITAYLHFKLDCSEDLFPIELGPCFLDTRSYSLNQVNLGKTFKPSSFINAHYLMRSCSFSLPISLLKWDDATRDKRSGMVGFTVV